MKLISMTDYVIENIADSEIDDERLLDMVLNYAQFLKQPLTLGMFRPCYLRDGVWIPYAKDTLLNTIKLFNEWEEAKSKVIFEGFDIHYRDEQTIILSNKSDIIQFATNGSVYVFDEHSVETIEDLMFYAKKEQVELTLTDNFKL